MGSFEDSVEPGGPVFELCQVLVCGGEVGSELLHCNPLLVVCSSPLVVAHDLQVVVAVWAVGGEIDGFLGIVCR